MPEGSSADYAELVRLVRSYVDNCNAAAALAEALAASGLTVGEFRKEHAERVIERAMVTIRLYCVSAKLPYLMIALADYCDSR